MIASCTSSLNSASRANPLTNSRSARNSVASTLSGLRLGLGAVNVTPVETSWYSSDAVAKRYALPTDAVSVHSGAAFHASTALGEKRASCTARCTTAVAPLAL